MTRYKYNFRVRHDAEWDTDYVGMKCLHCDYEEEMELDILLECSDPSVEESPVVDCHHASMRCWSRSTSTAR